MSLAYLIMVSSLIALFNYLFAKILYYFDNTMLNNEKSAIFS